MVASASVSAESSCQLLFVFVFFFNSTKKSKLLNKENKLLSGFCGVQKIGKNLDSTQKERKPDVVPLPVSPIFEM